eukprot:35232-Pyramimonas_sp.AAC.1
MPVDTRASSAHSGRADMLAKHMAAHHVAAAAALRVAVHAVRGAELRAGGAREHTEPAVAPDPHDHHRPRQRGGTFPAVGYVYKYHFVLRVLLCQ